MPVDPTHVHPSTPSEPIAKRPDEHRSPCPALNSLANGGHLPRDGRVTFDQLVKALHERLGIAEGFAVFLAKPPMDKLGVPGKDGTRVLDLADLKLHDFLEHDASLTRHDTREGDAVSMAPSLLDQLLSLSSDGETLTLEDVATAHQLRVKQSSAGGHRVSFKAEVLGLFEAALLYQLLRDRTTIPLAKAREFLGKEHVPAEVGKRAISFGTAFVTALKIAVLGNVPFSPAKRRAEELAASKPRCPFPHGEPRTAT